MKSKAHPDPIAIDGPAASGKSSLGRAIAGRLGYHFLDTGLMYRAFALAAMRHGVPATEEACAEFVRALDLRLGDEAETRVYLGDEDVTGLLHNPEIESHVSSYARLDPVRVEMREMQRAFADRGKAVLAGRDIGEVVLPHAPVKFYLEADEVARARRRNSERGIAHEEAARESHVQLSRRDRLDSGQTFLPPEAIVIDTTELSLAEVIAAAMEHLE